MAPPEDSTPISAYSHVATRHGTGAAGASPQRRPWFPREIHITRPQEDYQLALSITQTDPELRDRRRALHATSAIRARNWYALAKTSQARNHDRPDGFSQCHPPADTDDGERAGGGGGSHSGDRDCRAHQRNGAGNRQAHRRRGRRHHVAAALRVGFSGVQRGPHAHPNRRSPAPIEVRASCRAGLAAVQFHRRYRRPVWHRSGVVSRRFGRLCVSSRDTT